GPCDFLLECAGWPSDAPQLWSYSRPQMEIEPLRLSIGSMRPADRHVVRFCSDLVSSHRRTSRTAVPNFLPTSGRRRRYSVQPRPGVRDSRLCSASEVRFPSAALNMTTTEGRPTANQRTQAEKSHGPKDSNVRNRRRFSHSGRHAASVKTYGDYELWNLWGH